MARHGITELQLGNKTIQFREITEPMKKLQREHQLDNPEDYRRLNANLRGLLEWSSLRSATGIPNAQTYGFSSHPSLVTTGGPSAQSINLRP